MRKEQARRHVQLSICAEVLGPPCITAAETSKYILLYTYTYTGKTIEKSGGDAKETQNERLQTSGGVENRGGATRKGWGSRGRVWETLC